jgi:hypothetical protein
VCAQALGALLGRGLPLKVFHSLSTNLAAEGGGGGGGAQAAAQAAAAGALVVAGTQALAPSAAAVRARGPRAAGSGTDACFCCDGIPFATTSVMLYVTLFWRWRSTA